MIVGAQSPKVVAAAYARLFMIDDPSRVGVEWGVWKETGPQSM